MNNVIIGEIVYTPEQLANIEAMAKMMRSSLKAMKLGPVKRRKPRKTTRLTPLSMPEQVQKMRDFLADMH